MKHLTIDRSRWARGLPMEGGTYLLDPSGDTGKQCCVGIYLSSLGVEDAELAWKETADDVTSPLPDEANWLISQGSSFRSEVADKLYSENDRDQSEEDREQEIAALFAEQGIEVEFVGSKGDLG
jgi:hypothetical protein